MPSEIPAPPGIPLLGNILDVSPRNTWSSLNNLAKQYGPIFKINALGHQIVFVGSVALLEELCDQTRFRKCVAGPVVAIRYAVHDSLFTAYDHEKSWGIAHRIIMPHLTQEATDSPTIFNDMVEVVGDLTKKWSFAPKQCIKATEDLDLLLLASVAKCFFDERVYAFDLEGDAQKAVSRKKAWKMVEAFEGATMEAMHRPTRPTIVNWLYQYRFSEQTSTMRAFAAEIVKHRKEGAARKDMLDSILNGSDPETGEKLQDSQIIDEVVTIFIGAATAANLVSYALYYLMENPTEAKKATDEIDSVVGDGDIDLAHLKQLGYVEAILREALRLSATAPGFNIEPIPSKDKSKVPVLLAGGEYQIPHNQTVIAVLNAVNRDPNVFEYPEEFRPEQMLGEKWDRLPAAAKKGFGNGKRECIGKIWAWRWSLFTLASILKDVSFELDDKDYRLHSNGAFSIKPQDFYVLVGARQK